MAFVSAATHTVGSIAELQTRLVSAVPGDNIILKTRAYITRAAIKIDRMGSAAAPITLSAERVGGVDIRGTHGFSPMGEVGPQSGIPLPATMSP